MDLSDPLANLTQSEFAAIEAKSVQLQIECLQEDKASQPANTTTAYQQCWNEWRAWCAYHVPPKPDPWPPSTPWDQPVLPGDLVDEQKVLIFIKYINLTPPKTGKRPRIANLERLAAQLHRQDSGQGTDDDLLTDSQLKLAYNSSRPFISALMKLYAIQVTAKENPAPRPRALGLKCLQRNITSSKWAKDRYQHVDRDEDATNDTYKPSQIADHTRACWRWSKQYFCAFRTQMDFLLGNRMLLRSSNRRPLDIADLFCYELGDEGLTLGEDRMPTKILVVLINKGKANVQGNQEYRGAMRHRDPLCCVIGQLACWLFYRWHIEHEAFPDFASNEDWYDVKVLPRSSTDVTMELTYQTFNQWTSKMFDTAGIKESQTAHLPRLATALAADAMVVNKADIRRAGRWNKDDQIPNCYMNTLSRPVMRALAGFDPEWSGNYSIPRSTVKPSLELQSLVVPQLNKLQDKHQFANLNATRINQRKPATNFIELLVWLREIFLQDAPFLQQEFPDHPIWMDPIFARPDWQPYAQFLLNITSTSTKESCLSSVDEAMPAIASKLTLLSESLHVLANSITSQLQQVVDGQKRLEMQLQQTMGQSRTGASCPAHVSLGSSPMVQACAAEPPRPNPYARPLPAYTSNPAQPSLRKAPGPYIIPRDITTIVGLIKLWELGDGNMPSIKTLEAKFKHQWRPHSERTYFSKQNTIVQEVYRRAARSGRTVFAEAESMDIEYSGQSLYKVFLHLKKATR